MRHRVETRRPYLTRSTVLAVVALVGATAVTMANCSGETPGTLAPSVSVTSGASATGPTQSSDAVTPAPPPETPAVVKAAHLAKSVPVRLKIAAIGVDSALMELGLKSDGTLEVPPRAFPAGWFTGGPTPGELGPAIIVGHVDLNGPGVFYKLRNLKPGDQVAVTRKDGSTPVFRVTRVDRFPKDRFPTSLVYGNIDHAGLRLITCGGSFNRATGHYDDNFVAFADLDASSL